METCSRLQLTEVIVVFLTGMLWIAMLIKSFYIAILQKEWRENRTEFRRKVARCVRKSQEIAWD